MDAVSFFFVHCVCTNTHTHTHSLSLTHTHSGKPEWSAPPSPEEVQALFQPIDAAQLRPLNLTQDHLQSAARERKF